MDKDEFNSLLEIIDNLERKIEEEKKVFLIDMSEAEPYENCLKMIYERFPYFADIRKEKVREIPVQ